MSFVDRLVLSEQARLVLSEQARLFLSVKSNMAASAASREIFTDGVRAVLHTWPVLQVNTLTVR